MRTDVLNLEWSSSGRDIDIVEPVLSGLELLYGVSVARDSILNFELKLLSYRPKMLVMSNEIGAQENFEAVKLATRLGIKVVTLVSEGDFPPHEEMMEGVFWGWNKDRVFYPDVRLEWSERNVRMIRRYIPGSGAFDIEVSGATGFDRYKFMPFVTKDTMLAKYGKQRFSQVVFVPGFTFDLFAGDYFSKFEREVVDSIGWPDIEAHRASREPLRAIYRSLIEAFPDTLFVLKYHPGTWQEDLSEFSGLEGYDNTIVVKGRQENVADLVNAADLLITYNSTTSLEAWMLGKQTLLVNPVTSDFKRSEIAAGSPVVRTFEEARDALVAFFSRGSLPGFDELASTRDKLIEEIIGSADGTSHLRAAASAYQVLTQRPRRPLKVDRFVLKTVMRGIIVKLALAVGADRFPPVGSRLAGMIRLRRMFDQREREREHEAYRTHLERFYESRGIAPQG